MCENNTLIVPANLGQEAASNVRDKKVYVVPAVFEIGGVEQLTHGAGGGLNDAPASGGTS